jgi:hypothetical protein
MIKPFDERKSYLSIKAHEGMIAFAGFLIEIVEGEARYRRSPCCKGASGPALCQPHSKRLRTFFWEDFGTDQ